MNEPYRHLVISDWQFHKGFWVRDSHGVLSKKRYNALYRLEPDRWVVVGPEWQDWLTELRAKKSSS